MSAVGPGNGAAAPTPVSADPAAPEKEPSPYANGPDPRLEVLDANPVPRAAAPTIEFRLRVSDDSGLRVFTIALTSLITIEPAKRSYDEATRSRLVELFGEPERWATTTANFRWAQVDALVPGFEGAAEFTIQVACTYDLELAAAKYFHGLADGEAPMRFHFNGSVFYEAGDGRMQIVQMPWDCTARFRLPVAVWKRMIEAHYPHRTWVPVDKQTLERLEHRKASLGLPTFDAVLAELLDERDGR